MPLSNTDSIFFPYGSPTELYHKIAQPEERETVEHPYEYIQRVYDDSTANSKLTGLPGYSPPWFVRLLNGATLYASYITFILTIQFLLTVIVTMVATGIEMISTVRFTVGIPYTGWEVYTMTPADSSAADPFILIMTPILLSFLLFWGSLIIFWGLNSLSKNISAPYEKEYADWLDEIKPTNTALPPGLAYAYRDDDLIEENEELPVSVPPFLRQLRTFEKIAYSLGTVKLVFLTFLFSTLLWQNQVLLKQNGWLDGTDSEFENRRY